MRELLKQALAALKTCDIDYDYDEEPYGVYDDQLVFDAIEALEHELSKTEFLTNWRDHASPYEQGFIDGMAKQAQSSVDRAVNGMHKEWQGLTDEELVEIRETHQANIFQLMFAVEAKIREKNNAV